MSTNLTAEQTAALRAIRDGLVAMTKQLDSVEEPMKAIMVENLFIMIQKADYVLGE